MPAPSIEKHELPAGTLSFSATPNKPLIYYTGKADARGMLSMRLENKGKEFIVIPVEKWNMTEQLTCKCGANSWSFFTKIYGYQETLHIKCLGCGFEMMSGYHDYVGGIPHVINQYREGK